MLDVTRAYNLDFLFPRGDDTIGASLARYGEFARPEADFLVDCARAESSLFVDVGANIGAIALPFARVRPRWRVVAIEAHRGLANVLAANALANRLYNVEPMHAAAGPEARITTFPSPSLGDNANYGTLSIRRQGRTVEPVRMMPLDDFGMVPQIVKIDVEGFENEVLAGARRLLEARQTIWLAEASDQLKDERERLIQTYLDLDYTVCWFFAPFVTPSSQKAKPENVDLGDMNIVALPPGTPNAWDLPVITDPAAERPRKLGLYKYLTAYGY